jgi:hypothetical protein
MIAFVSSGTSPCGVEKRGPVTLISDTPTLLVKGFRMKRLGTKHNPLSTGKAAATPRIFR